MHNKLLIVAKLCAFTASLLALLAAVASLSQAMSNLDSDNLNEWWRVVGLFTFAALFALLGFGSRSNFRLWEVLIASKLLLVILALGPLRSVSGSQEWIIWDGILVVILVTGYVCVRIAESKRGA